jgi:GNAT superfamily N-acetyltransferase
VADTLKAMNEITCREATGSDAPAIAELHAESWRASYRGEYRDEYLDGDVFEDRRRVWNERFANPTSNQFVVVAEREGEVVGFACVYAGDDPQWGSLLDNIHVRPDQQSRGIGATLMQRVFEWCAIHHPNQGLYLWVLNSNRRAQSFYSLLGAEDRGGELSEAPGGGEIHGRRYVWDRIPKLE